MNAAPISAKSIFLEAVEFTSDDDRAAYLEQHCGEDARLRHEVDDLLLHHVAVEDFLASPPTVVIDSAEQLCAAAPPAPSLEFLSPTCRTDSLGRLGHYEILEVIGSGGMGVVMKAFDEKLHRVVAIKAMAPSLAASDTGRQRFVREAQAAAAVNHDNIVDIYAVEEDGPVPYLVMEFVAGISLEQRLRQSGALEPGEILRIGLQTADGLAAAHRHGLVHRDVKPANILLQNGLERVKITDFGLACAADDVSLTQTGVIAGTPIYMSPEQARGDTVDHRSDLFSLGSVFYEMSTGHTAFRADNTMAVLHRVCNEAPPPIREENPEIPPWLSAIIDRLLAKDPSDRYQSTEQVVEVLSQCLTNLQDSAAAFMSAPAPVAKPAGGYASRWRGLFTAKPWMLTVVVFGLLLAGLLLTEASGLTQLRATVMSLFAPHGTLIVEIEDPAVSVTVEGDGSLVITGAGAHEVRLKPGAYTLQTDRDGKPLHEELISIVRDGRRVVTIKQQPLPATPARPAIGPRAVLEGHESWVRSLAFSPDGSTLATGSNDQHVRVWETKAGNLIGQFHADEGMITSLAYSPNGAILVAGSNLGRVRVWDADTFKLLDEFKHDGSVQTVAFCGSDSILATASWDTTVKLWKWDGTSLVLVRTLEHASAVSAMCFHPKDKVIATTLRDGSLCVWDSESGESLKSVRISGHPLGSVAYSPDGATIAVGVSVDKKVELRKADTLEPAGTLRGHKEPLQSLAFLHDGKILVSAGAHFDYETNKLLRPGELKLWDVAGLTERLSVAGIDAGVRCVAVSPDGKTLAAGDFAGVVRLWEVDALLAEAPSARTTEEKPAASNVDTDGSGALRSDYEVRRYVGHTAGVLCVGVSPDGKRLVSSSKDATARLWDLETGAQLRRFVGHSDVVRDFAFFDDGKQLVSCSSDGTIRIWDVDSGQEEQKLTGHAGQVSRVDLFPDGKRLASGGVDGTVRVWDLQSRQQLGMLKLELPVYSVAMLPDGRHVLCGCAKGGLQLWDVERVSLVRRLEGHSGYIKEVAVSPDGRRALSAGSTDGSVRLWDLQTGEQLRKFEGNGGWGHSVAFSSNGELALIGIERVISLWNLVVNQVLRSYEGGTVFQQVALTPDGCHAASASWTDDGSDNAVRLWELPESVWPEAAVLARLAKNSELIEAGSNDPTVLMQRARIYGRLKKYYEAVGDFSHALDSLNGVPAFRARLAICEEMLDWDVDHFEGLVELRPADINLWRERGEVMTRRKDWNEAARCYQKRLELGPDGAGLWRAYAIVLLAKGDEEGYRDLCARMLVAFSGATDPVELRFVAHACILAPDAVKDNGRVLRMAQFALTARPDDIFNLRACAACLYRCGEWEETVALFSRAAEKDAAYCDYMTCFQAMAHHRLGHAEEAHASQQRVHNWKTAWNSGTEYFWRVPGERLIAEMDSVLKTKTPIDSPPSENRADKEAQQN